MDTTLDVVVVGGGLAGLAAAAFAARGGLRVRVLERSPHPGGRARTRDRDGFLFNVGPHALYRRGPGRAVLRELGVEFVGAVPPYAGLAIRDGRAYGLPVGPGSLLRTRLLPARAKLQVAGLLARLQRGVPKVPSPRPPSRAPFSRSWRAWARRRCSPRGASLFVPFPCRSTTG